MVLKVTDIRKKQEEALAEKGRSVRNGKMFSLAKTAQIVEAEQPKVSKKKIKEEK